MPYYEKELKQYVHNIKDKIKNSIYLKIEDLYIEAYTTKEPVSFEQRDTGEKKVLIPGDKNGETYGTAHGSTLKERCRAKQKVKR